MIAAGIAGKIVSKAVIGLKLAGFKAFLNIYVGASAANISIGLLTTATATIFWETKVLGNSDDDVIAAAVGTGVTRDVEQGIAGWVSINM